MGSESVLLERPMELVDSTEVQGVFFEEIEENIDPEWSAYFVPNHNEIVVL
ncbi:hypothetical protein [Streptomyces sp. NPDC005805]|uniref:hypothetical protein n=1 Tax=Streptomyces sp. NPDC005805 TaxID=3157068 RepID=UPI0033E19E21